MGLDSKHGPPIADLWYRRLQFDVFFLDRTDDGTHRCVFWHKRSQIGRKQRGETRNPPVFFYGLLIEIE